MKEAYKLFKSKNQNIKIKFSKFVKLRPKECVLDGVCICTIHQNMKLMFVGAQLGTLTNGEKHHLIDYYQCIDAVTSNKASSSCYLGDCSSCSNLMEDFILYLMEIFDKNSIDDLIYKQWLSTDRTILQTVLQNLEEFTECFHAGLQTLKKHDFIAKEQSKFCSEKRKGKKKKKKRVL